MTGEFQKYKSLIIFHRYFDLISIKFSKVNIYIYFCFVLQTSPVTLFNESM